MSFDIFCKLMKPFWARLHRRDFMEHKYCVPKTNSQLSLSLGTTYLQIQRNPGATKKHFRCCKVNQFHLDIMLFQSRPAKMGVLKGCKLGLLPLALCELHLCYRSFQLFGEINWNYLAVFNFSLQPAEYATILVIFFFKML